MPLDLMVDLETLSTKPWAVIVSLGAVLFDPDAYNVPVTDTSHKEIYLYRHVDIDSMLECGGHVEQQTVLWWMDPKRDNARAEAFRSDADRWPIIDVVDGLTRFCKDHDVQNIWSHGLTFDVAILNNLYATFNKKWPVSFRACRDTRTLFDRVPKGIAEAPYTEHHPWPICDMSAHHPVYDSYVQARQVQTTVAFIRNAVANHGR